MASEQWHSDIIFSDEFVRHTIEKQFPELAPVELICLGEGWDNKAFLINKAFIFRFPRRKIAAQLIEKENAILQYIQHHVELNVPELRYIGKPTDKYPYYFHGYPMIVGECGCHINLTETDYIDSIIKLARFLKQLHSLDEEKARAIGVDAQTFNRTNVSRVIDALKQRVEKIQERQIAVINQSIIDNEIQIAKQVKLPDQKVLIHGDLYCRHLIFNQNKLTGIIDWGDAGINSPAVDLAVIFSVYPHDYHDAFFDVYGAVDEQIIRYARFLGLYSAITLLLYAADINDIVLVSRMKESILRINSDLLHG